MSLKDSLNAIIEAKKDIRENTIILAEILNKGVKDTLVDIFPGELKELKKTQSGGSGKRNKGANQFVNPDKPDEQVTINHLKKIDDIFLPAWFVGHTKDELINPELKDDEKFQDRRATIGKLWEKLVENKRMTVEKKTGKVLEVVAEAE